MARTARTIGRVLVGTMAFTAAPAVAAEPTIAVRLENVCNLAPQTLHDAQERVARIYAAIGVSIAWVNQGQTASQLSKGTPKLDVFFLSQSRTELFFRGTQLPEGILGIAPGNTRRVYVFCGRIASRAQSTGEAFDRIVARVLAHELGHQLLPGNGHSDTGIMRAWLDYFGAKPPMFTDPQGAEIRALLLAAR